MNIPEIPLTSDNQQFNTAINGVNYSIKMPWRDYSGWITDLQDSSGADIVTGIPLVTGANLLAQFSYLNLGFGLAVICDDPAQDYPTKTDLGINSHLLAVTE